MRWREAGEAVRMARFLNLLHVEICGAQSGEAAELLGVSERTFGAGRGATRRRAKLGFGRRLARRGQAGRWIGQRRWSGFIASATGLHGKHFHEHLIKDHGFGWGYTWLKLHLQWKGVVGKARRKGAHRRSASGGPAGMMLHQDGSRTSGWQAACARSHRDDGRCDGDDLLGGLVEEEGTASTFKTLKEVFGEHGLPMSLYTDRGAHYFHTPKPAAKSTAASDQVGRASSSSELSTSALFAAGAGPVGARVRNASGSSGQRARARWLNRYRCGQRFIGEVYLPATMPLRDPGGRRRLRFTPFPASTSTRSCASRRSARSA